MLGLRALSDVQGGVERHAAYLYPRLVELGCEVEVVVRTPYHPRAGARRWRGVHLTRLWSPRAKGLEAMVHSFLATVYAGFRRPDVVHIHAIGPGLMAPLARLFGLRVVVTHHGPDYEREKWGGFARRVLRLGESAAVRFAHECIVISEVIRARVLERCRRDTVVIPNGVVIPEAVVHPETLARFGIAPGRYVLQVSRLVPEKRQLDLIRAFRAAGLQGWKLVLVGDLDDKDAYTRRVLREAGGKEGVVLTGYQQGDVLQALYAGAGLFVLPSSHEGLPIALLEALSFGIPVLASAIPANRELGLDDACYFPLGDVPSLSERLRSAAQTGCLVQEREARRRWVAQRYDWAHIAEQTLLIMQRACAGRGPRRAAGRGVGRA